MPRSISPSTRRPSRPTRRSSSSRRQAMTSAPALVDNLAASIYKQGEQANAAQDYRAAANHFLRIKQAAPTSQIRAAAEYDAGAALIRCRTGPRRLRCSRRSAAAIPITSCNREATKQIAFVYRQSGQLSQAAGEYERIATESERPESARRGAAGRRRSVRAVEDRCRSGARRLHALRRAVPAAARYGGRDALQDRGDLQGGARRAALSQELQQIVRIDAQAGAERTNRTRTFAARSALVLAEQLYRAVRGSEAAAAVRASLQEKQRRMDAAMEAFGALVDYEIGDVTAAATFYMARDVLRLQSRADGVRAARRPARRGTAGIRAGARGRGVPFEEQAIDVHEKNMELMRTGIYNAWIEKSLAKLADADAGSLREGRDQQRLPRFDRALRLCRAHRAPAARACSGGRGGGSAAAEARSRPRRRKRRRRNSRSRPPMSTTTPRTPR